MERVRAGGLRQVLTKEMKPHCLGRHHAGKAALRATVLRMGLDLGAKAFLCQSRALRGWPDRAAPLHAYRARTLVLCGAESQLCPPERRREMAGLLSDTEPVVLPGSDRLSTLEAPDAVNAALRRLPS